MASSLGPLHSRRLREIWRSAGWPCQDLVEVELLVAGLLERVRQVGPNKEGAKGSFTIYHLPA